jgi:copper(I)-binding protein
MGLVPMARTFLRGIAFGWIMVLNVYGQDISPISLSNLTVRPAKTGQNSAAFVTIKNNSSQEMRLVKASTPLAGTVELHRSFEENGIHKMRPVNDISIVAEGQTSLEPGGLHIMLIDLQSDLVSNPQQPQEIPITLTFDSGDRVDAFFLVEKCGVPCH